MVTLEEQKEHLTKETELRKENLDDTYLSSILWGMETGKLSLSV